MKLLCTAFSSNTQLASGTVQEVAIAVKKWLEAGNEETILVFNNATSAIVELDLQGSIQEISERYRPGPKQELVKTQTTRKPGRPKLGVVGHEVTLLPRHWEWLRNQPGGASVALRKLVDQARRDNKEIDQVRQARKAINVFMTAMTGNLAGFEEANRALFSNDLRRFNFEIELWPTDIKTYIDNLALNAFTPNPEQ